MSTSNVVPSSVSPLLAQQQQVVSWLGLPDNNWEMVDQEIAGSSTTWMHDDWVVQQRPVERYQRMQCLYNFSVPLDGMFPGFKYHGPLVRIIDGQTMAANERFLKANHFWMAQPRIQGSLLFGLDINPEQLLVNLELALPYIAAELDLLAGHQFDAFALYRTMPTSGLVQQNLKFSIISQLVDTNPCLVEIAQSIPYQEPQSCLVLSHGDPTLKNVVANNQGVYLIDWESMWLLPRHRDFVHMVAFLAKYMDTKYWDRLQETVWHSAKAYLPEWNKTTWHQAVTWQLLREAVYFPNPDRAKANNYLQALRDRI